MDGENSGEIFFSFPDPSFYLSTLSASQLIADAIEELSLRTVSFSLSMSFVGMLAISAWIDVVTATAH